MPFRVLDNGKLKIPWKSKNGKTCICCWLNYKMNSYADSLKTFLSLVPPILLNFHTSMMVC